MSTGDLYIHIQSGGTYIVIDIIKNNHSSIILMKHIDSALFFEIDSESLLKKFQPKIV